MSSEEWLEERAKARAESRVSHVNSLQERQVETLETIAYNLDKIMKMMSNETKSKKEDI